MKKNFFWLNYEWIIIQNQIAILEIKSSRIRLVKLCNQERIRPCYIWFDTSDLAAKKDFIALNAEVDKLDINKLINVPTSLNNLKAKVDDLDVGTLKTVFVDLSDVVDNKVI